MVTVCWVPGALRTYALAITGRDTPGGLMFVGDESFCVRLAACRLRSAAHALEQLVTGSQGGVRLPGPSCKA